MLLPPSAGGGDPPAFVSVVGGNQLEGDPLQLPQEAVTFPDHPASHIHIASGVGAGLGLGAGADGGFGMGVSEVPLLPSSATPRSPMRSMAGRLSSTGELLRTGQEPGHRPNHHHDHHHHPHHSNHNNDNNNEHRLSFVSSV